MNAPRPHKPQNWVEWFKVAGIIFGALIAGGTVLHFIGVKAQSEVIAPAMQEIRAQADTTRHLMWSERQERVAGDDEVKTALVDQSAKLDEIHDLLVGKRRVKPMRDPWTEGGQPRNP